MKKRKFCIMMLLMILFININFLKVEAISLSEIEKSASEFIGEGAQNSIDVSGVTNSFKGLGQILTFIGAGVLVIAVTYMGIKYLISPPDKQGALKQQLIGIVVSGVVIFGAYGIWKAILGVVSKF